MTRLYTRSGDDGYTRTITDEHISKTDDIICLIGTLDEFSACLGVAKVCSENDKITADIKFLQEKLIAVMGELAGGKKCITCECVSEIEELTDKYSSDFEGFTLPGENILSAYLNLARCVIRRAERIAAGLMEKGKVGKETYCYLNRLSSLMYSMSRYKESVID